MKKLLAIAILVTGLSAIGPISSNAQIFTALHQFTTNKPDGTFPLGPVAVSGNTIFGATQNGGAANFGAMFQVKTDGTGYSTVFSLTGAAEALHPFGGVVMSGGVVYGFSLQGGQSFNGSLYFGDYGYEVAYGFAATNGTGPSGPPAISGNYAYGTTFTNGANGYGNIFKVGLNGSGFTILHSFSTITNGTNFDGGNPFAGVTLSGSTVYGVGTFGGGSGSGTIFKINTDGTGFTVLRSLNFSSDGSHPIGGLVVTNGVIYGTTEDGGQNGYGTIFKLNTDGTAFTVLHNFTGADGAYPQSALTFASSNILYGSAVVGGNGGNGTLFAIKTDGTGFNGFYSFSAFNTGTTNNGDGANPVGALVIAGTNLYGTATGGGTFGQGTLFKISIPSPSGPPAFFAGEASLGNNVYYLAFPNSDIFGYYNNASFPYVYHYDLGYEYFIDANDGVGGAYFYDFSSGHFWYTSPAYPFPYLYDFTLNAVLYCFPDTTKPGHYDTNPRFFYNTATSSIFSQ